MYSRTVQNMRNKVFSPKFPFQSVQEEPVVLLRRHVLPTLSFSQIALNIPVSIYNGYDYFTLKQSMTDLYNFEVPISQIVSTREARVVHKAKLTKAAKKNQLKRTVKKATGGKKSVNLLRTKISKKFKK